MWFFSNNTGIENMFLDAIVYKRKEDSEKFTDLEIFLGACKNDEKLLSELPFRTRKGIFVDIIGCPDGQKVYLETVFLHDAKKNYFPKMILLLLLFNTIFLFLYTNYDNIFLN